MPPVPPVGGTPFSGLFACLSDVYAVYRPDELTETFVPVEAWDSTGEAWIVGPRALVQASTLPGFDRLTATGQLRGRPDRVRPPDVHRFPPTPLGAPV